MQKKELEPLNMKNIISVMCENPIRYVPNNKIVPSENTDNTTWCPKPGSNRHVF